MFRVPSSSPEIAAKAGFPPEAITPTSANWEAPVKTSSDSAQDCHTSRPAATEMAPKEIP